MQPWSVMRIEVVPSRIRFMSREAARRHISVLAADADGADVVGARIHGGHQPRDLLGRVLQVGIERDHVRAARLREGGEDRQVLAGIACQHHHAGDVRAALELLAQLGDRAVGAAVVDEHHLVAAAERIQRRIQPLEQLRQALLLVVYRNDDRDFRVHLRAPRRMSVAAATTRSTSPSSIAGNSGSVTVSRPMRSACGNWPSR